MLCMCNFRAWLSWRTTIGLRESCGRIFSVVTHVCFPNPYSKIASNSTSQEKGISSRKQNSWQTLPQNAAPCQGMQKRKSKNITFRRTEEQRAKRSRTSSGFNNCLTTFYSFGKICNCRFSMFFVPPPPFKACKRRKKWHCSSDEEKHSNSYWISLRLECWLSVFLYSAKKNTFFPHPLRWGCMIFVYRPHPLVLSASCPCVWRPLAQEVVKGISQFKNRGIIPF